MRHLGGSTSRFNSNGANTGPCSAYDQCSLGRWRRQCHRRCCRRAACVTAAIIAAAAASPAPLKASAGDDGGTCESHGGAPILTRPTARRPPVSSRRERHDGVRLHGELVRRSALLLLPRHVRFPQVQQRRRQHGAVLDDLQVPLLGGGGAANAANAAAAVTAAAAVAAAAAAAASVAASVAPPPPLSPPLPNLPAPRRSSKMWSKPPSARAGASTTTPPTRSASSPSPLPRARRRGRRGDMADVAGSVVITVTIPVDSVPGHIWEEEAFLF